MNTRKCIQSYQQNTFAAELQITIQSESRTEYTLKRDRKYAADVGRGKRYVVQVCSACGRALISEIASEKHDHQNEHVVEHSEEQRHWLVIKFNDIHPLEQSA